MHERKKSVSASIILYHFVYLTKTTTTIGAALKKAYQGLRPYILLLTPEILAPFNNKTVNMNAGAA